MRARSTGSAIAPSGPRCSITGCVARNSAACASWISRAGKASPTSDYTGSGTRSGATGSSSMRARTSICTPSTPSILSLRRGDGDELMLTCEKQRDIGPFTPFRLRRVPLGDSCVMQLASNISELGSNERKVLEALSNLYTGQSPVASGKW